MTHPALQIAGPDADPVAMLPDVLRPANDILPAPLEQLDWVSGMLCQSGVVPHLLNQPGRSMAVAYAAARLNMDPVGFASKTYFTPVKGGGERMSYEAQLVVAILYKLAPIVGRLDIDYEGKGAQRYCIVRGRVRGIRKPKVYTSPIIGQIKPKNSPLWFSDPDQQLAYYSQRAWGRRYTPEALLGVYSPDEFQEDVQALEEEIRANPFDDSDLPTPEPSGGAGWKAGDAGQRGEEDQGGGQRSAKPKDQKPPKGDGVKEPEDMPEVRQFVAQEQARIMKLKTAGEIDAAFRGLEESKQFRRLIAYDPDAAKACRGALERRFHELEKQPPGDDLFPGDRK